VAGRSHGAGSGRWDYQLPKKEVKRAATLRA
jgi:hypothetical protein